MEGNFALSREDSSSSAECPSGRSSVEFESENVDFSSDCIRSDKDIGGDGQYRTVEIWENQRNYPLKGWSSHLLPGDREPWTDKTGLRVFDKDAYLLPYGWDWESDWGVEVSENTDEEGWTYAINFTTSIRNSTKEKTWKDVCRRRRWQRVMHYRNCNDACSHSHENWVTVQGYGFPMSKNRVKLAEEFTAGQAYLRSLPVACQKWRNYLNSNNNVVHPFSKDVKSLIRKYGIPPHLRRFIWMSVSGASRKVQQNPGVYETMCSKECPYITCIDKDVRRTFPEHPHFTEDARGGHRLRRVLVALANFKPDIGYVQGFNFVAAIMLLHMCEEEAFWLFATVLTDLIPPDWYTNDMRGVSIECSMLNECIREFLPRLDTHFEANGVTPMMLTSPLLIPLTVGVFPLETSLRVWDVFFHDGTCALSRAALAAMKLVQEDLINVTEVGSAIQIFQYCNARIYNANEFIDTCVTFPLNRHRVVEMRRKQSLLHEGSPHALVMDYTKRSKAKSMFTRQKKSPPSSPFSRKSGSHACLAETLIDEDHSQLEDIGGGILTASAQANLSHALGNTNATFCSDKQGTPSKTKARRYSDGDVAHVTPRSRPMEVTNAPKPRLPHTWWMDV